MTGFGVHRGGMDDATTDRPTPRAEYPAGVPCWIDLSGPDPEASVAFYGGLFGWESEDRLPAEAPGHYFVSSLDGLVVAGVGGPADPDAAPPRWATYVSVDDLEAAIERVAAAGGTVLEGPTEVGPAGHSARCTDPSGAEFFLWLAAARHGVELVNAPGSWNWSNLATPDPDRAAEFYAAVFGWEAQPATLGDAESASSLLRLPGYGDVLAERDPALRARQAAAVPDDLTDLAAGFADAVAWIVPSADGAPAGWDVTFAVADTDAVAARAVELGGTVEVEAHDLGPTRLALLRDPQGVPFTISHYDPTRTT